MDKIDVTVREMLPFIVMIIGVVFITTGAIWQIVRQNHERQEHIRQWAKP